MDFSTPVGIYIQTESEIFSGPSLPRLITLQAAIVELELPGCSMIIERVVWRSGYAPIRPSSITDKLLSHQFPLEPGKYVLDALHYAAGVAQHWP